MQSIVGNKPHLVFLEVKIWIQHMKEDITTVKLCNLFIYLAQNTKMLEIKYTESNFTWFYVC